MNDDPAVQGCQLQSGDPLRILLEGTATTTGERFFEALVENLARALDTKHAWITEYHADLRRLKALAFWVDGELLPDFEVDIDGTPCEAVIDKAKLVFYPDNIRLLFPRSEKLKDLGAVSYMGVPLMDLNGSILGHMAAIDDRPMAEEPKRVALFQVFAARAAAELMRIRAESEMKERERQLRLLVTSAMDAIIELDEKNDIVMLNPAAEKLLNFTLSGAKGRSFPRFLSDDSRSKLHRLVEELKTRPAGRQYLMAPGGLDVIRSDGKQIFTEATLSRFEIQRRPFYALILRDINDRIESEKTIHELRNQAAYLKAEIKGRDNAEEIVGRSRLVLEVLHSVEQVAKTDATVLILGETGTGKELIARAIHRTGSRTEKPFVKLNCAALPEKLVESELFGHEPGAFTGADQRRKGRFELADGGTFFLDEIGELSDEVQAKLLRVLQEGQFERLGGSRTTTVDVRVIAASNRDLQKAILSGRFRADLFYRLNVYPITVPPLRNRKEDIPLLAEYFLEKISARLGKTVTRIHPDALEQMMEYGWPGNVRELKNIVERAVITSPSSVLQLPEPLRSRNTVLPDEIHRSDPQELPSLDHIERKYISHVLQTTRWRISGARGAAKILDLNPSTLRYRMKKLGIQNHG